MDKYQDKDSFWHDKPTNEYGDPSSNNGWIYSAYSKYLAPHSLNLAKVDERFLRCLRTTNPLKIDRLPFILKPPMSKDEIIGITSLGFNLKQHLKNSFWNFCNLPEYRQAPLTLKRVFQGIKALWSIRKEHRNYLWQNKILKAYPLAFRLDASERYYIKRMTGEKPTLFESLYFHIAMINTYLHGKNYSRMILWLQLSDMKHYFLKHIPLKTWVLDYFGPDHTFYKNLVDK